MRTRSRPKDVGCFPLPWVGFRSRTVQKVGIYDGYTQRGGRAVWAPPPRPWPSAHPNPGEGISEDVRFWPGRFLWVFGTVNFTEILNSV